MRTPKGRFEDLANLQTGESGRAMRMFLLTYEYGSTTVPLARCAELFGFSPDEAAKRAARAALPVPAFDEHGSLMSGNLPERHDIYLASLTRGNL